MAPKIENRTIPYCVLALAMLFWVPAFPMVKNHVIAASAQRRTPEVEAIARCRDAVVNLRGEKLETPSEGDSERHIGMGTGILIDSRGYILTNYHVVSDIREIQVGTSTNEWFPAKIVSRDPETDLAILKIDAPKPCAVIPIGTSCDLMQGERVIALGNAYGYEHTATFGYISAVQRPVQINGAQFYEDLIQTDASINPGNSGGPLLNIDGELIGVNVAVRENAQGIGFAIPVDRAMSVASRLLLQMGERTAQHGMALEPETGRVVSVTPGSAAEHAGIQTGDQIVQIDDQKIERKLDSERALLERTAGETLQLSVKRTPGEMQSIAMTLTRPSVAYADQNDPQNDEVRVVTARLPADSDPTWDQFGMSLTPASEQEVKQQSNGFYTGGLKVVAVRPGSPAANQSVQAGDMLVGLHRWKTLKLSDIPEILGRIPPEEKNIKFYILRNGTTLSGTF
ncbi:MAG: trypsin-like peptidase domain-containing protein [Thermoguttaceae bacterium]|nr:trypsin-like peptidase domain-containing protein [Thermoguttaceae bacterium]